jgi:hypothetical protein
MQQGANGLDFRNRSSALVGSFLCAAVRPGTHCGRHDRSRVASRGAKNVSKFIDAESRGFASSGRRDLPVLPGGEYELMRLGFLAASLD